MLQGETLQQACYQYWHDDVIARGLLPKTAEGRRETLNRVLKFIGDEELTLVTAKQYILFLHEKGWKESSRCVEIKVIRSFLKWCIKCELITNDFGPKIEMPKIRRQVKDIPNPEMIERAIIAGTEPGPGDNERNRFIKSEMRLALQFELRTGLRFCELDRLQGSNLRTDNMVPSYVVLGKGGNETVMPIPLDLLEQMKAKRTCKKVFQITEATCNLALKRGCASVGLTSKVTCHTLRHVFCSYNLERGVPVQKVKRLMRHSSIEITDNYYTHIADASLAQAINSQSIVTHGLTSEQMIENFEKSLQTSGIKSDMRFNIKTNKEPRKMVFELSW